MYIKRCSLVLSSLTLFNNLHVYRGFDRFQLSEKNREIRRSGWKSESGLFSDSLEPTPIHFRFLLPGEEFERTRSTDDEINQQGSAGEGWLATIGGRGLVCEGGRRSVDWRAIGRLARIGQCDRSTETGAVNEKRSRESSSDVIANIQHFNERFCVCVSVRHGYY
jgi:hypothetical protein